MKVCKTCQSPKDKDDFHKGRAECKRCLNDRRMKLATQERRDNPEKFNRYHREFERKLRQSVITAYGAVCACCGEDEYAFLAIDHVFNDGGTERRAGLRSNRLYRHIIRLGFPPSYQILCHNCNQAKNTLGKCPHKERAA